MGSGLSLFKLFICVLSSGGGWAWDGLSPHSGDLRSFEHGIPCEFQYRQCPGRVSPLVYGGTCPWGQTAAHLCPQPRISRQLDAVLPGMENPCQGQAGACPQPSPRCCFCRLLAFPTLDFKHPVRLGHDLVIGESWGTAPDPPLPTGTISLLGASPREGLAGEAPSAAGPFSRQEVQAACGPEHMGTGSLLARAPSPAPALRSQAARLFFMVPFLPQLPLPPS